MSRSTQYIGLTNLAKEVVQDAYKVEPIDNNIGMFDEGIPLRRFFRHPDCPDVNEYYLYEEVVQDAPWSSGPMYFTCLHWYIKKLSPMQENNGLCDMGLICQWVYNPLLKSKGLGEFDEVNGHYQV